jgi:hypothetical protein
MMMVRDREAVKLHREGAGMPRACSGESIQTRTGRRIESAAKGLRQRRRGRVRRETAEGSVEA